MSDGDHDEGPRGAMPLGTRAAKDIYDVVIIGGGPAGSACATRLVEAGLRVAVLDRAEFPRTKLCAGWITPDVVEDLAFDIDSYPHRLNTFEHVVVHVKGLTFSLDSPQHSIRRYEFDDYLTKKSGANIHTHNVKNIDRDNGDYVIDERFRCRFLVGAGGTRCPVYRSFFKAANPRAKELQVVTCEQEFPYSWSDPRCHLWFFERGLAGYAWYVPKAKGYLNCGIGGIADKLKARGETIKDHWRHFTELLGESAFVNGFDYDAKGYSYYVRGNVDIVRIENAFITGDAAGLATRDLCEGIGPAVTSGLLAASSILDGAEYSLDQLAAFSNDQKWISKVLEYMLITRMTRSRPS